MKTSIAVVGAGVSGLAVAHNLKKLLGAGVDLTVYEKGERPGGAIYSKRINGFLVEWGPNGFLNNEPATFELIKELGIRDRLVVSSDTARKRFLLIGGALHQIPLSPPGFLATKVLPLSAKLRFAMEPFIAKRGADTDESVADFVARRFGRMAVERMFDPLMSGIYAGDVNALSIQSTLKVFHEMEQERGSVVRGMFARIKQRRAEERKSGAQAKVDELVSTSKNPMSNKLLSFAEGMNELISALAEELRDHVRSGVTIESLTRVEKGFDLVVRDGNGSQTAHHDIVVIATPPEQAAPFVAGLDEALAQRLTEIKSSTIAVIGLGFKGEDIANPLDGFGYLIPRKEGVRSLGVLWSSSIFPGRAPVGHKLLQIMIGGAHDLRAIEADDQTLVETAMRDADRVLGFRGAPVLQNVIRHKNGIPQYNLGHKARLREIQQRTQGIDGLHLAGNGYFGISANDCIRHARELAGRIAEGVR
jgi:oxygen-dependent protoporphyrinogen oxidase